MGVGLAVRILRNDEALNPLPALTPTRTTPILQMHIVRTAALAGMRAAGASGGIALAPEGVSTTSCGTDPPDPGPQPPPVPATASDASPAPLPCPGAWEGALHVPCPVSEDGLGALMAGIRAGRGLCNHCLAALLTQFQNAELDRGGRALARFVVPPGADLVVLGDLHGQVRVRSLRRVAACRALVGTGLSVRGTGRVCV
jgi:hypothetical protein